MAESIEKPSPQVVANAFVHQYYQILHNSPARVHRFYQDISQIGRPSDNDGTMNITTNMEGINEKILSLNYNEIRPEIKTVDAQESYNGGVHVLVTGCHVMKDNLTRNFSQSFFLAPQEKGYFVFSDIFRYTWNINHVTEINVSSNNVTEINVCSNDEKATLTPCETPCEDSSPSEIEQIEVPINKEISIEATENGEVVVVEVVPAAEVVVVEVADESREKVESDTKVEDVPMKFPKKSYASIVKIMKERKTPIKSAPAAPRGNTLTVQEKPVKHVQASVLATEVPHSGSDATEDGNNQEGEVDNCSIYIKGLPLNATPALLEEEFKKFGSIKSGGIQVRSNKSGFCFGFVEFEVPTAVEKALVASPVMIGGRQAFVEEKRPPYNSRLNNNKIGRSQAGRGAGFRNDGPRGGGAGRGGGYFVNRGGIRGRAFSNRGGGGGGMGINGAPAAAAKATSPRVSATA